MVKSQLIPNMDIPIKTDTFEADINSIVFELSHILRNFLNIISYDSSNIRFANNLVNPVNLIIRDKMNIKESLRTIEYMVNTINEDIFIKYRFVVLNSDNNTKIQMNNTINHFSDLIERLIILLSIHLGVK